MSYKLPRIRLNLNYLINVILTDDHHFYYTGYLYLSLVCV